MAQLGGHSVLLSQNYIGWGVRETIRDVASNLDRWVEGIMARTYGHDTLVTLASHADVPVINGLSDRLHPCQLLADYVTLLETFGELKGLRLTFVSDIAPRPRTMNGFLLCFTMRAASRRRSSAGRIACCPANISLEGL